MEPPDERPHRHAAGSPVQPLPAGRGGRSAWVPLALLAAVVTGGLLGSWAAAPGRPLTGLPAATPPGLAAASGPPSATAAATASPVAADPYADLVETCGYPSGWRAATLQHWLGRTTPIRTWTAEDPVPADGASDPAIPFAPVATDLVLAIGYCSPVGDAQPPQGVEVEIWAVPDGGPAARLPLERLEPPEANALGGLWLPPAAYALSLDGRAGWRPGRYAVRLLARSYDRWLGVEIEDISGLQGRSPLPGTGGPTPPPPRSPAASGG